MHYEVEQKLKIDAPEAVERRLVELGARPGSVVVQVDRYFNHPARDFGQTDEALRIRQVGERNFVTYKGPKIDAATKTRRELELPLASGEAAADAFAELLAALGFRFVLAVRKQRRTLALEWNGREVELALDEIESLGTFAEIELSANESELDDARAALASLAAELGLATVERRSYLELLLERASGG